MADPPQSASPDDLALAQLIPLLCDDIWAKANCQLRLRDGSRLVVPVETLAWAQVQQPPGIDIEGEGLFTLVAVGVPMAPPGGAAGIGAGGGGGGPLEQQLVWLLCNVPDYDIGEGTQVASYVPPEMGAPCRIAFLLYRQPGDAPAEISLLRHQVTRHLNQADEPADQVPPELRRGFHARALAAAHHLGLPVAAHWVEVHAGEAAARAQLAAHMALQAHLGSTSSALAAAAEASDEAMAVLRIAAALRAAEAAVDAGAAALGWQWQHAAAATSAVRQQLGSEWRQPLSGHAACTDEFGLLRLLYEAAKGNGSVPPGSVAEWLESNRMGGDWVKELAAQPPYSHSSRPGSLADVSMAAGELAVLPGGTLAWSLPASLGAPPGFAFWSPAFELGGNLWRLFAFAVPLVEGTVGAACMHLGFAPATPPRKEAELETFGAAVVAASQLSGSGGVDPRLQHFTHSQHDGPPFQLLYISEFGKLDQAGPDLANTFGDACQQGRGVRMRRSAPSVAAWRRWWQLFSAAAWVPVGAGLEGLTRCLLLAVRSQWSRQAAGTGLLALLVHQLLILQL
ncbi:Flowering Locus T [Micractinium conductrix]|uniref:Flowering Locus T n=1 Tax=Micractinium conductrix TaxID=554055 RepID=A0A2P6VEW1_9CHLO|nr:Flowering Locus T [Micractinium conductrix]|eukprot:PSC72618.1 Flowering Locus T [Micractinium conductrix]